MNESGKPVIVGTHESQLYELDRVEIAFFDILTKMQLPAQRKRDVDTNVTPRVELELTTSLNQLRRHNVPGIGSTQLLPYCAWDFELKAAVVTNREQNGDNHLPLIGITRWTLQMYRLKDLWTPLVCPTHIIVDIREEGSPAEVWNEGGLDTTTLTFSGMFAISEPAW